MYKKLLTLSLYLAAFILIARFCHKQTDGFRMSKITRNTIEGSCPPPSQEIEEILSQKFTYLARGLQSFVFVSEDEKYVLKIFNNKYQEKIFYTSFFPFLKEKQKLYESKLQKTFNSYNLAFDRLKEEAAIIYLKTSESVYFKTPLYLLDKLGIEHPINLNHTAFLIQKKASMVYPTLDTLMEKGKEEEARKALRSLLFLVDKKFRMNIKDKDPLIRTNIGFIGTLAIQIDVGPFSLSENRENYREEFKRITTSLKGWLQHHHPSLTSYVEEIELEIFSQ